MQARSEMHSAIALVPSSGNNAFGTMPTAACKVRNEDTQ